MIFKYLYILLFLFFAIESYAQQSFQEDELKHFVEVYMTFKVEKKKKTTSDLEIFNRYEVSPSRYREITQSLLIDQSVDLKENEKKLFEEIKKQNNILKKSNKELIKKICANHDLPWKRYEIILHKFNSDIQFQRSLKPHFDNYLNRLK